MELVGYHIPQEDGSILEGGIGYLPGPYGLLNGLLTFYAEVDIGITSVYLDGEYVGYIDNYWPGGITCDNKDALNVFRPDGIYNLVATSSKGYRWEGSVEFKQAECGTIRFNLSKGARMEKSTFDLVR